MTPVKKAINIFAVALSLLAVAAAVSLCAVFPNKYARLVNEAADEFDLPRPLVRSVVWAESRFDPSSVSGKGAMGLMQLMPSTLEECAAALGLHDADGFDPETSLRCGCYYLKLQLKKFDGDETAALVAYNAGELNAKKYIAGDPLFPETSKYLESVAVAERVYGLFD